MSSSYQIFHTRTGRRVWVRAITGAEDTPYLVDIFAHLSPQSRYMRFHEPLDDPDPEVVQAKARELAENVSSQGRGWLAFVHRGRQPKVAVGGVRWVRLQPDVAEIALTVRDDFQEQGIGRELLRLDALDARTAGIKKLIAVYQGSNQAVSQLLRHSPLAVHRVIHAGEIFIETDLTDAVWAALLLPQAA